jgi:2,3-bisphosphoglycerate-dependent phosphoglycerate mutase
MFKSLFVLFLTLLFSCHTTTYYIVRHAEKEPTLIMTSDVPLSAAGKERAIALKDQLRNKGIKYLYSTNYSRTLSTIEPLRRELGLTVRLYGTKDTLDRFIAELRNIRDGNVLIAGHANTVGVIVNTLTGKQYINGDLPDSAYGDLFVVTKRGNRYDFKKSHFGK